MKIRLLRDNNGVTRRTVRAIPSFLAFCLIFWSHNPPALFAQASCFSSSSGDANSPCSADFSGTMTTQPVMPGSNSSSGLTLQTSSTIVPNEERVLTQIQRIPRRSSSFPSPVPTGSFLVSDAMTIQSILEGSAKVEAYDAVKDEGRVTLTATFGSMQLPRGMVAYLYLLKNSVSLWGVQQMARDKSNYRASFTGPAGHYRAVVEVPDAGPSAQKILAFSIESKNTEPLKTSHEHEIVNQQELKTQIPEENQMEENISEAMHKIVSRRVETDWKFPMGDKSPAYYHPPGTDPEAVPTGKDESQTDSSE